MTRNSDQRMLQPASIKFTSIQLPRLRTTTHNTKLAYTSLVVMFKQLSRCSLLRVLNGICSRMISAVNDTVFNHDTDFCGITIFKQQSVNPD